jgi:hypothetical protein
MGTPVLRLSRVLLPDQLIDLTQGESGPIEMADAQAIAVDAVRRLNPAPAPAATVGWAATAAVVAADELEDEDQWTVGRYHADQPLFRFAFDDPQRSTLYVSGANGRLVLRTTATQRFWNWVGAIPHWFYPTVLRSDGELWSQTVIWASMLGSFLALFGLYLGLSQLGRGRGLSPYRGLFYWHHLARPCVRHRHAHLCGGGAKRPRRRSLPWTDEPSSHQSLGRRIAFAMLAAFGIGIARCPMIITRMATITTTRVTVTRITITSPMGGTATAMRRRALAMPSRLPPRSTSRWSSRRSSLACSRTRWR